MIRAEQVKAFVDDGSMQLGREYMPGDFETFLHAIARPDKKSRAISIDEVTAVLPNFSEAANQILEMAGYRRIARPVLEAEVSKMLWPSSYPNYHCDYGGRRVGISFLFSDSKPGQHNCLVTAGRGETWDHSNSIEYPYSAGPIVIAQAGFGAPEGANLDDFGPTWHAGTRSNDAPFVAIDLLSVYKS